MRQHDAKVLPAVALALALAPVAASQQTPPEPDADQASPEPRQQQQQQQQQEQPAQGQAQQRLRVAGFEQPLTLSHARQMAQLLERHDRTLAELVATAEQRTGGTAIAAVLRLASQQPAGEATPPTQEQAQGQEQRTDAAVAQDHLLLEVATLTDAGEVQIVLVDPQMNQVLASRPARPAPGGQRVGMGDGQGTAAGAVAKATDLIGKEIVGEDGEEVAEIEDLIIDADTGRIVYAVLSHSGALGIAEQMVPVPWQIVSMQDQSPTLNVDPQQFEQAPTYVEREMPDFSDRQFALTVHEAFGVQPYWQQGAAQRVGRPGDTLHVIEASNLVGCDVENLQDEDLGEIADLAIDPQTGQVKYAVLSHGGLWGIGDTLFAVPLESLGKGEEDDECLLDVSEDELEAAEGFDDDNWPATADPRWRTPAQPDADRGGETAPSQQPE